MSKILPTNPPSLNNPTPSHSHRVNINESVVGGTGRGERERGTPRGGKGKATLKRLVILFWLRCPFCDELRREYAYWDEIPPYLSCKNCNRVIPTPAWRVTGYGNLGTEPKRLNAPILMQDWKDSEGTETLTPS